MQAAPPTIVPLHPPHKAPQTAALRAAGNLVPHHTSHTVHDCTFIQARESGIGASTANAQMHVCTKYRLKYTMHSCINVQRIIRQPSCTTTVHHPLPPTPSATKRVERCWLRPYYPAPHTTTNANPPPGALCAGSSTRGHTAHTSLAP